MSRACGLVVATTGVVASGLLAIPTASARPVRLDQAGTCDLHGLDARVAGLTGGDPFDDEASAGISVRTRADAGKVIAEIRTDDGNHHITGPRIVSAATCNELLDATATIVAMAIAALPPPAQIDADDADDDLPPELLPASERKSAAPRSPAVDPDPDPEAGSIRATASRSSRNQLAILVGGAGTTSGDHTMAQAMAGIRLRRGGRSLTLEAHVDSPESMDAGVGHIAVWRAEATLSPCLHFGTFAGCALASLGTIHGESTGFIGSRSAATPLVGFGGRATWEHPLTDRWALRVHLDVSALATETRFDVDNMAVWKSQRVEGSAGIGVFAQFP